MKFFLILVFCLLSLPGFSQEDDNKMIEITEAEAQIQALQDLKALGHENIDASTLMDEKAVKILQKILLNGPLSKSSEGEVRQMILAKLEGKPVEKFLKNNPVVLDTVVDILRDKSALSSLLGIFARKRDLKSYFYIWLVIFIGTWILKRRLFEKKKSFSKSLAISLIASALSIFIFYKMFHDELSPTLKIIAKHISF